MKSRCCVISNGMRVQTTDSRHSYPISPNLVNGRTPDAPDVIWAADFTYIACEASLST